MAPWTKICSKIPHIAITDNHNFLLFASFNDHPKRNRITKSFQNITFNKKKKEYNSSNKVTETQALSLSPPRSWSHMKARSGYDKTRDPKTRKQRGERQEQETREPQRDRDVRLHAERVLGRTRVGFTQVPRQWRTRGVRWQHQKWEALQTTVPSNSRSLYVDRQITHRVGFDRRTGSLEILKHLNQTGRTLTRESLETVLARNSNRTHIPSWTQDSRRIRHDANRKSYRTIPAVRCETPKIDGTK